MKVLVNIVVISSLAVFAASSEKDQEKPPQIPGCEKYKDFSEMSPKKCCAALPNVVEHALYKDCKDPCKSKTERFEKWCCMSDCVLKASKLLNDTGFIDLEAVTKSLNEKVKDDEKWVSAIKESITTCTTEAPQKLEAWKANNGPKCETAINMVTKHCVLRQLFFNCPEKTDSKECKDLEAFGKGCPLFPMPNKKEKKSGEEEST